ncbi:hypothetical protein [Leisingera sp. M658]|uniref:hypothetical protein n=1 Tax=Leisingera sp. M658 TaxID=2867015 RepID=UPI0021A97693|nr:hypothetical protein [Leisingera sp. M658]UWQ76806.1 hypothetical protein K3724_10410 [Leisingera sp. M658]
MSALPFFDPRTAIEVSGDDSPVSGGVRAVLERGYAMRLNSGRLDGKLLAATPQELEEISEALSLPLSVLQNRSAVLEATLARQFAE